MFVLSLQLMYFHTSVHLLTQTSHVECFMLCRVRQTSVTEQHNRNSRRLLQFLINQNNELMLHSHHNYCNLEEVENCDIRDSNLCILMATLAAFPLPFKLRKLKLRFENSIHPMETRKFRKTSHLSQKSFYARMRLFFCQFEKEIFCKPAMETVFAHLQVT